MDRRSLDNIVCYFSIYTEVLSFLEDDRSFADREELQDLLQDICDSFFRKIGPAPYLVGKRL